MPNNHGCNVYGDLVAICTSICWWFLMPPWINTYEKIKKRKYASISRKIVSFSAVSKEFTHPFLREDTKVRYEQIFENLVFHKTQNTWENLPVKRSPFNGKCFWSLAIPRNGTWVANIEQTDVCGKPVGDRSGVPPQKVNSQV